MMATMSLVGRLLVVALAYYVGASVGFVLTFPQVTPSVLWPPNAIVTTTLLLTRPHRWWMYLLAILPAHLAVELPVLSPPSLVFGLFFTNCAEAVIGAGIVHWLSDEPTSFDTLRRMAVFIIGAAIVAPFLSTFPDAALVTWLRDESYRSVWLTRFPSNVLAELTIPPTLIMLLKGWPWWPRTVSVRRRLEALLLAVGLLVVGLLAFGGPPAATATGLWSLHTPFALLLPFLLWSAARFGPRGLSLCLLTTVILAIRAGMLEVGVFTTPHREDGVLALQVFLAVVSIPLLAMASVMEERRRTSKALAERLRFEEMLARLSNTFVHVPSSEMDQAFENGLGRVADHLNLDGLALVEFTDGGEQFIARSWTRARAGLDLRSFQSADFPWATAELRREQTVVFADPGDLPERAAGERALLRRHGVKSGAVVPLEAGGQVLGGLVFVTLTETRAWSDQLMGRLHLVGELFANALARRETEDALRASEGMKSAILASLGSGVAVLDRHGTIIAVNESWTKRAVEVGATSASRTGVGDNYLVAWREEIMDGAHGREAVAGIRAVLDRRREAFALAYPCAGGMAGRWFELSAVPLHRTEGGAVIAFREITDWKRAELDAQRSREELAHFTRVSTMGALAASLAHELNQPLTGILSNAQAARRFLEVSPPDLHEINAILADIIDDDKRAGDVIERLRELLKKGGFQAEPLDLNALIRDVARLLGSDALIRNVRIQSVFTPQAPLVAGDRIQVQQVVLNLLVNAMDAMADCPRDDRIVTVETTVIQDGMACVAVRDAGVGFDPDEGDRIFEPFYTTKPQGMGMGLSISRSIVEAHGGRIWAASNPGRGTTFRFTLPLTAPKAP
jgi:signal transduction histidine kinase/integral membrane sensor domain MASE1/GAF domain-containing protein